MATFLWVLLSDLEVKINYLSLGLTFFSTLKLAEKGLKSYKVP
jgi:hypothetical protein